MRPKKLVLVYLRNIFCKFFSLLSFDRLLRSTASIAVTEINFSITGIRTWGGPNENCLSHVTTIDHTANQTSQLGIARFLSHFTKNAVQGFELVTSW